MAQFAQNLYFLFFTLLLTSLQIEARGGSFFFAKFIKDSKVPHIEVPIPSPSQISSPYSAPVAAPIYAPAPAPENEFEDPIYAPTPAPENEYGERLYGRLPGENTKTPSTTTATTDQYNESETHLEDELEAQNYARFDTNNEKESYSRNRNSYNNNNNGYSYNGYNNNAYMTEPQGMSDTRLLENGKYYYDVENGNQRENEYESHGNQHENEYESQRESSNKDEGYYTYGDSYRKSKYEFDSMEEYERQEGYPEVRGAFVP